MPTTATPVNLDKLRNAVQRYGSMSFTTAQVAADYQFAGEATPSAQDCAQMAQWLQQHAAVLGIRGAGDGTSTKDVWQPI